LQCGYYFVSLRRQGTTIDAPHFLQLGAGWAQQFKPLRRQTGGQEADAGEIATGPAKACDKAFGHRITDREDGRPVAVECNAEGEVNVR